jgi:hypothetical protein
MPTEACNFATVFRDEAVELVEQCKRREVERDLRLDNDHAGSPYPDRIGVAYSGGGVRSASIALGVTQRLAKVGILRQVHYISGISGGTYLLSWLTAWIKRTSFKEVEKALGFKAAAPLPEPPPADEVERFLEPAPLHFLRKYISYLTPRLGLASGDTLAAIAIYLRNVLLNQTMLASALVSFTLLLQLLSPPLAWSHEPSGSWLRAGVIATLALFVYAIIQMTRSLNDLGKGKKSKKSKAMANRAIGSGAVACSLVWLLLPAWHAQYSAKGWTWITVAVFAAVGFVFTAPFNKEKLSATVEKRRPVGVFVYFLAWVICGLLAFAIDEAFRYWLLSTGEVVVGTGYVVFGLGLLMLGLVVITFLFIGILGDALSDSSREWLARFAGYFILFGAVSVALLAIELYGPMLIHLLFSGFYQPSWKKRMIAAIVPGGWLFVVVSGLIGGKSSKTSGDDSSINTLDRIVTIAPPVFLVGLLLFSAWATHALALHILVAGTEGKPAMVEYLNSADFYPRPAVTPCSVCFKPLYARYGLSNADKLPAAATSKATNAVAQPPTKPESNQQERATSSKVQAMQDDSVASFHSVRYRYLGLFLVTLGAATLLALRLDVNEFSMNLFYRNRLVRTFLGASNVGRRPSLFTGFAADDDIALDTLTTKAAKEPFEGPYPIWGTTLNITSGENLAWQQRKGASFIYSPLFCGWDYVDPAVPLPQPEKPATDDDAAALKRNPVSNRFGYRSTLEASEEDPGYGGFGGKPFIGTAMAASGAAASPNMGYHTRPAVAALLAIFNVRLGWWTGNPRNPTYWKEYAPGIWYLFAELFAHATDSDQYVYLSDGGHFENLGIYELVRRRVRFIICSDGDADGFFQFGDLANAVEHCRADFGVQINVLAERTFKLTTAPFRETHYAVGKITYPDSAAPGILLYIKSSLTDNEPADVLGMRATDPSFPHDTTANQFFDEARFEAYRALGEHMMDTVLRDCNVADDGTAGRGKVLLLYNALLQRVVEKSRAEGSSASANSFP